MARGHLPGVDEDPVGGGMAQPVAAQSRLETGVSGHKPRQHVGHADLICVEIQGHEDRAS
jgi:hypothetical protein